MVLEPVCDAIGVKMVSPDYAWKHNEGNYHV